MTWILCPRCQTKNDKDERWCHFCRLDFSTEDTNTLYVELASG